jgi:hypothetical protein
MKYAIIENGVVTNVALADEALGINWIASDTAQIGWAYDGSTFTAPTAPAHTVSNVITERQRRLTAGFDYDFADARGVHRIGTTKADLDGWDEVSKAASALVALGLPNQEIGIVTDTGPCNVTAIEWQSVLVGAMQFRQPIFAASFVLQASDPIPQNYADDSNWSQS